MEMWSEENCEYNLIAILDQNSSNDPEAIGIPNGIPDPGEPTGVEPVWISCHGDPPCLSVTLDCVDGYGCVDWPQPEACTCTEPSCMDAGLCTL